MRSPHPSRVRLGIGIGILWALVCLSACDRSEPSSSSTSSASDTSQSSTATTVNGQPLSAKMTDPELLRAFKMDPGQAASDTVQGKDGTATIYRFNDQELTITRSMVSGVHIVAKGPIKGDWALSNAE